MKYRCVCGNISKISFNTFKRGSRCKECKREKLSQKFRHSFQYIKEYFKNNSCELMETYYKNNATPLRYKCSCGNITSTKFANFKKGKRCAKCAGIEKLAYEYVYNYFKENGCELLVKKYKNANHLMRYKCICKNISKISFSNFKKGHRCKKCGNEKQKRIGKANANYNPFLTDEERESQKSRKSDPFYKKWRNSVFKRDKHICRKCNNGGRINAHHIENFYSNKKLRMKKSNGITLCVKCHNIFHKTYGKKHNNKTQMENFLGTKNLKIVP